MSHIRSRFISLHAATMHSLTDRAFASERVRLKQSHLLTRL
jgi:hypothetical protein